MRRASSSVAERARPWASQLGARPSGGTRLSGGRGGGGSDRRPACFGERLKSLFEDDDSRGTRGPVDWPRSPGLGVFRIGGLGCRKLSSSASPTVRPGGGMGSVLRGFDMEEQLVYRDHHPNASIVSSRGAPSVDTHVEKIWLISPSIAPCFTCLARASSFSKRLFAWSSRRRSPNERSLSNLSRYMSRSTLAIS